MKRFTVFFFLYLILSQLNLLIGQNLSFKNPLDISNGKIKGVTALDVADFNNDGLKDVVVLEGGAHAKNRSTIAWFEQTMDKKWFRHDIIEKYEFDDFIGSARCGDIDNDGDYDFICSIDGHTTGPIKIYFFENPGKTKVNETWPFHIITTLDGIHANDMRLADIDSDGKLDVIVRHKEPESVKIIFQNNSTDWDVVTASLGQAGEGLAVGDINRDGLPDITITGHWLKTPKNPRKDEYIKFDIEAGYKTVNKATKEEVGDIDGDGLPDVVLSPAEHFPKYGGNNYDLAWYKCPKKPEKSSAWEKHVIKSDYNKAHCAKLADFDNDGDLDILTAVDWDDLEIKIYLNDSGKFDRSIFVTTGKGVYSGAVADMDSDGDIDIVGENKYSNDACPWYYENNLIK